MFSKSITNSSQFLMMPQSSQNLYFHLGMNADDDGFCEHFAIMRMTESKPDDLKVLQAKGFVRIFDDKVLVISQWKENNYIQSDRYTASKYLEIYKEELALLSEGKEQIRLEIPDVYKVDTQVRLGKDRIEREATKSLKEVFEESLGEVDTMEKAKFLDYWTEKNPNGRKERWQLQQVFDVSRRWATWLRNVDERKFGKTTTGPTEE
jgi:hypothetical protein